MTPRVVVAGAAVLALALSGPALADEAKMKAAARAALVNFGDAVITVKLNVKRRMVFQGREDHAADSSFEVAGTVLTPAGLTVVADSASNPFGLFLGGPDGPKIEVETTDVKMLMADGREIPARFVLRDSDLDLAFVAPVEKGLTLPNVNLEKSASPAPLDDLVFLYRLGKSLNREVAVTAVRVRAVVKKPRTFLVTDLLDGLQSLGRFAFDDSGRAVGLVVLRHASASAAAGDLRGMLERFNPVVITAADVLDVAAQATASKTTSK